MYFNYRLVISVLLAAAVLIGSSTRAGAQESPVFSPRESRENLGEPSALLTRMVDAAGYLYALDPALIAAIAQVESGNDPDAVSPRGAIGLMQLMPRTARRFGVTNPSDPAENLLGAARFLSYLRESGGRARNLPELLAAYNAGEGAVTRYGGIPPYAETRDYVRKVLITYLAQPPSAKRLPEADAPSARPRYSAADTPARELADPFRQLELIQRGRAAAIRANGKQAGK